MKIFYPVAIVAVITAFRVKGDPIETCNQQYNCIDFTVTQEVGPECPCSYKICAKLDLYGDCIKKENSISHTCKREGCVDQPPPQFSKGNSVEISGTNGLKQCQYVPKGGYATFLFKDGNGCTALNPSPITNGGLLINCAPSDYETCTGGGQGQGQGNIGKECIWTVRAPLDDPKCNHVSGDPHFQTHDGFQYNYHGQCDLVMARSDSFGSGLGLEVHGRTEIITSWSRVSNAAVRIGEDIFEVVNDGSHLFNGMKDMELPLFMSGQYLVSELEKQKKRTRFQIELGNGDKVYIVIYKKMISVKVEARLDDMVGMLGSSGKPGLVGRDGQTVFENPNKMGDEWQVNNTERMLFHDMRAPQYPEKCVLPAVSSRRRLSSASKDKEHMAEEACADIEESQRSFCIEDVLLTDDASMAGNYGQVW